ncbi:MAG: arsenic efflux protein [Bacteroidales bacterium]|jgi:hypothetical protein|nr:arsenic efflux protein [Bacteroidales bacterium]
MNYLNPLYEATELTLIVMVIMMALEYIQLWRMRHRHNKQHNRRTILKRSPALQTFLTGILGFIPGCAGGLAAVSLYAHGTVRFGALLAASFTALGDDMFRMIGIMPVELLWLMPLLLLTGFTAGFFLDRIKFFHNFHTHSAKHIHSHEADHTHAEHQGKHFVTVHLWGHVIKKHFIPIFLWTLGTLYVFEFLLYYFDLETWLHSNPSHIFYILLIAIAIGWIPQSGPHFIFAQMWVSSFIPFSIFLANAIVQDGHTSLILLAESRKQFIFLKAIKSIIALAICSILLL